MPAGLLRAVFVTVTSIGLIVAVAGAGGCDQAVGLSLSQLGVTDGNNDQKTLVEWDADTAIVQASAFPLLDYDIYDLGSFTAGEVIRIEANPAFIKPTMLLVNADTSYVRDGLDGGAPIRRGFDHTLDKDAHLLLYVGPGHARVEELIALPIPVQGDYRVSIQRVADRGREIMPRAQSVVIDFGGGVDANYFPRPTDVAPFVASDFGESFAGFDAEIKREVMRTIRLIYTGYDVNISSNEDPPFDGPVSRVFVTTPGFFGDFAGGQVRFIDFSNRDPEDVAIVSVKNTYTTDPMDFARRLGRLAAHELGHLLGLLHQQEGLMSYNAGHYSLVDGPLSGYFGFIESHQLGVSLELPWIVQPTTRLLSKAVGRTTPVIPTDIQLNVPVLGTLQRIGSEIPREQPVSSSQGGNLLESTTGDPSFARVILSDDPDGWQCGHCPSCAQSE